MKRCRERDAHLVEIRDLEEWNFVKGPCSTKQRTVQVVSISLSIDLFLVSSIVCFIVLCLYVCQLCTKINRVKHAL